MRSPGVKGLVIELWFIAGGLREMGERYEGGLTDCRGPLLFQDVHALDD